MAERKKRIATRTDAVVALVVGLFVTVAGASALPTAIAERSEQVDTRIALILMGLGLITIGVIDWRMAGVEEPPQPWPRIRRVAKWSSVTALLATVWLGQPDDSRLNLETMRMRSMLRQLADAESAYFATYRTYSADTNRLQAKIDYHLHEGPVAITRADSSGWDAMAKSLFSGVDRTCSMSVRREGDAIKRSGPRCTP